MLHLNLVCAVIIKNHASLFMAVDWDDGIKFPADALLSFTGISQYCHCPRHAYNVKTLMWRIFHTFSEF
jgi:hypothetical protein